MREPPFCRKGKCGKVGYHRRLTGATPRIGPAIPRPLVLGGPGSHPHPIDPHTAEGGLIGDFDEVLDLGIPNAPPGRSSIIMPAGSGRRRRLLRSDSGTSHVGGHWRKLNPSAELMAGPHCGAMCVIQGGRLPRSASPTQRRRGARGSLPRRDHAQRGVPRLCGGRGTGRPVTGSATMAGAALPARADAR